MYAKRRQYCPKESLCRVTIRVTIPEKGKTAKDLGKSLPPSFKSLIMTEEQNEKLNIGDESGDRKYFTQIPNMIVNHSTAYEQSLYLIMKRIAGESGSCYSSLNFLAKKMGVHKTTVSKTIEKLLVREWVKEVDKKKVQGGFTRQFIIIDLWELNLHQYKSGADVTTNEKSGAVVNGSGAHSDQEVELTATQRRTYKEERKEDIDAIFSIFNEQIRLSRNTGPTRRAITSALKDFNVDDLKKIVEHKSGDDWFIKNNARRGALWFFSSKARLQKYFDEIEVEEEKKQLPDIQYCGDCNIAHEVGKHTVQKVPKI